MLNINGKQKDKNTYTQVNYLFILNIFQKKISNSFKIFFNIVEKPISLKTLKMTMMMILEKFNQLIPFKQNLHF